MSEIKICCQCKRELPLDKEHFSIRKDSKDGFKNQCRDCINKNAKTIYTKNIDRERERSRIKQRQYIIDNPGYSKQYYDNNIEILKSKSHERYVGNNRVKTLIAQKKYRVENCETVRKSNKKYYEKNSEKLDIYRKIYTTDKDNVENIKRVKALWKHNNKDKICRYSQLRRAKMSSRVATLTLEQWISAKFYFDNKCAYCNKESTLTQDHFLALSKGGEYTINNIVPSCLSCNSSKRDRDFFIWYPKKDFYSKQRETKILKYLNYNKNKTQQIALIVL